ncbi:hypothetical protein ACFQFH_03960 [Halobaculum halobium]|uniref:Proteasome lid subunit RPN8/RPN11, contains Jab1/MPN metalloenzyme (JAMM) motif n=2 Tax=Halobaculum halobium TaxID=3032281 RepID=A0ABD5T6Z4_9EURY|nr:hypothetical protein [Halobaculum sp. SYNS20]
MIPPTGGGPGGDGPADATTDGSVGMDATPSREDPAPVYITADLLSLLVERAADADPKAENVVLDATPGGELVDRPADLDPSTPVLTHFYFPAAAGSVSAVFGMDLGRPAGRARFLSHPDGDRRLTEEDDLAAAVLVAVPPYDSENVTAYDRRGRRRELVVVDAHPPEERVED